MNQQAQFSNNDDVISPEAESRDSKLFAGLSEVTWALLGTGFLLGILIGSVFIVGRARSTKSMATESSPSFPVATLATAESPVPMKDALAIQRQQLQRELETEKLRLEVAALRQELADLHSRQASLDIQEPIPGSDIESTFPSTQQVAATSPGMATLTYWNQLNTIILQEAAMRSAPNGGVTASNAGRFLEARKEASDFAVESIRQLGVESVDPEVLALGEQLSHWYAEGRKVAEKGLYLLTQASTDERQGSPGKDYQAAERGLSRQVNEINANGERVRQSLIRDYGLDFPPLN